MTEVDLTVTIVVVRSWRPSSDEWHQMDWKGLIESDAASLERVIAPWGDGADPLNEQLAAGIGHAIHRGDLPPGTRLPSERELANRLGVSRTTIVAAYDRLRSTGMVRSRQGSGTRVVARTADAPTDTTFRGPGLFQPYLPRGEMVGQTDAEEDVISLTIGALPGWPGLAGIVEQTVREDLPELLTDFGYLPFGLPALRTAICRYLEGLGLPTREDEVLVTSGAQQAVHLVSRELAGPDAAVAIEDPTYLGAVDALRAVGARMLPIPLDADGIRLDVLARTLAATPPAFVYVVPTYQNPTGSILPEARRRELVRLAEDHRTLIVEDLTPTLGTGLGLPPPIGTFAQPRPGGHDRIALEGRLGRTQDRMGARRSDGRDAAGSGQGHRRPRIVDPVAGGRDPGAGGCRGARRTC